MKKDEFHEPVLIEEVIKFLEPEEQSRIIDATLGSGGHSLELAKKGARILGIDADSKMLDLAKSRFKAADINKERFKLVQGNFRRLSEISKEAEFENVSGILFDLGVSNIHLLDAQRGFSFANPEAELDMRLDSENQSVKANDLLNVLRPDQLRDLFENTLDGGEALWLTRKIVSGREIAPIKTVGDLLNVARGIRSKPGLNPLTLPMLALRIAVNSELVNLKEVLPNALGLLAKGGKLAIISFHSGEDKIVKEFFKNMEISKSGEVVTRDVIVATEAEIERNPRARSAKMRVLKKI